MTLGGWGGNRGPGGMLTAYYLVYGFGHLRADCGGQGSALEPYSFRFRVWDFMAGATGRCGGGGQCPPHLGPAGYRGRSNDNEICFYSRQSLFSTVQVTEFQLP